MRVAVIGAGIAGVATAYELAAAGAEVTVFDRRSSVAAEASFANAGLVAPAALAFRGQPLSWKAGALGQLPWLWRHWRARPKAAQAARLQALHRLAAASRDRLLELTRSLDLEYEQNPGLLWLLRAERDLKAVQPALALLRDWGVAHDLVDGARARALEPGLNEQQPLHAAVHLTQDGVGNCRQFAHLIKAQAQRQGASFRFEVVVRQVRPGSSPEVETADGARAAFEQVVLCAGLDATALLRPLRLKLPLLAVHGYALTAPLRPIEGLPLPGPRTALVDARSGVTLSRLGQRLRATGVAEIGGRPDDLAVPPLRTLYRAAEDWFPGAASLPEAQHWKGARPTLPDGAPLLGDSGLPGLWLNLGHGAHGWTLACGAARVLAERMAGREAPVDISAFSVARLR